MRKYILLSLFCLPLLATAQITIDDGDMPEPNVPYTQHTMLMIGSDYTNTGTSFVWDFSNLSSLLPTEEVYWPMDSVGITYYAVFGLPFDPNAANLVQPLLESPIDLGLPIGDGLSFYSNKSAGYKMVGYGIELSGIGVPIKLGSPDVLYEFPLDYGDSFTNVADLDFSFPGVFYYGSVIDRSTEVDGWGTIYLPTDTFEVLRVKSIVTNTDSIYMDSTGTGFSIPPITNTEYTWLAKNGGLPVLKIVDNGLTATAYYQADIDTTNLNVASSIESGTINVFPNPASEFTIQFPVQEAGVVLIDLFDLSGKHLETIYAKQEQPGDFQYSYAPQSNLSSGTYLLKVQAAGISASKLIQYQK